MIRCEFFFLLRRFDFSWGWILFLWFPCLSEPGFRLTLGPMKPPQPRRKCLHCKGLFLPDYRGGARQCDCLQPDCRKARKRVLQRAWLAKPENQDYFRDEANAKRARDWQKEHPNYWKIVEGRSYRMKDQVETPWVVLGRSHMTKQRVLTHCNKNE